MIGIYKITNKVNGHIYIGQSVDMQHGELHSRAKLTAQDVIDIRTRYANLERCMVVYQDYEDRIGRSGFNKIWKGETWKDIMPEIYTPERAEYHKNHTANPGNYNGRALLTDDQVLEIRRRFQKGEPLQEIYKDYQHTGITYRAFEYSARGYNRKYLNSKL